MVDRQRGPKPPPTPTLKIPEGVAEYYANAMQISMSPWDLTLLFGSNALAGTTASAGASQTALGEIRIDVLIRMSPQHAKAVAKTLARMVTKYEDQFGLLFSGEEVVDADNKSTSD